MTKVFVFVFVSFLLNVPVNNFSCWDEPLLPGYYQYFLGGKCIISPPRLSITKEIILIFQISNSTCICYSWKIWATSQENLSGLPTKPDTNRAVQPQDMARGLKFRISKLEER